MQPGSSIINAAWINADTPNPATARLCRHEGAIQNITASLAQLLADKGIRANCVAPGPIWTPLIPSTMPAERVKEFGTGANAVAGTAKGVAPVYVMLAAD